MTMKFCIKSYYFYKGMVKLTSNLIILFQALKETTKLDLWDPLLNQSWSHKQWYRHSFCHHRVLASRRVLASGPKPKEAP